ncbi:thioredoxin domain-containing protein 17 isoform X1 [Temnothorax nylanderi]|uniref:thioredoxin domain-containing protein 17 isoform X1 n=1 Tax=Temnothorax nylanderi TaxID=102681 RepID=UPI003A8AAC67
MVHVRGYENFLEYVKVLRATTPIYMLYTGTKLEDTGKSWCPDCVEAEPFIEKGFEAAPEGTLLVTVEVGDRPFSGPSSARIKPDVRMVDQHRAQFTVWGGERRSGAPHFALADPRTRGARTPAQR